MEAATLSYGISTRRLLLLTVLSYGFYFYYWFYLTWRQYRDHTGKRVFPVWHTLALGVPIYGLFRIHDHMTSYNRLILQSRLAATIKPVPVVALILVSVVLSTVSFFVSGVFSGIGPSGVQATFMKLEIDALTIVITAGLLTYVQPRLNGFWDSLPEARATDGKIGAGETICVMIGVLAWVTAALSLVFVS